MKPKEATMRTSQAPDKKEDTKATSSKRKKADEPTEEKADDKSEVCVAIQLMEATKRSQC